jgi:hypothetical protein
MDPVPLNRVAHGLAHHEPHPSRLGGVGLEKEVNHHRAPSSAPSRADGATKVVGPAEPVRRRQHGLVTVGRCSAPTASGRQALATLATTGGEDGAARTGAHPKTEAVLLVPATVVRLERPLAHWNDSGTCLEITLSTDPLRDLPLVQVLPSSRNIQSLTNAARSGRLNTGQSTVRGSPGEVKPVVPRVLHKPVENRPGSQQAESLRTESPTPPPSTRHAGGFPQIELTACG